MSDTPETIWRRDQGMADDVYCGVSERERDVADDLRTRVNRLQRGCSELSEQIEQLRRERDKLREAIREHRRNVWGGGKVKHEDDIILYLVLDGGQDE